MDSESEWLLRDGRFSSIGSIRRLLSGSSSPSLIASALRFVKYVVESEEFEVANDGRFGGASEVSPCVCGGLVWKPSRFPFPRRRLAKDSCKVRPSVGLDMETWLSELKSRMTCPASCSYQRDVIVRASTHTLPMDPCTTGLDAQFQ